MNQICSKLFLLPLTFLFSLLFIRPTSAQDGIGIGTESVNPDAVLEIESSNKGLLIPRMTSGQRITVKDISTGITSTGIVVYDTDDNVFYYYDGSKWLTLIDSDLFNGTVTNLNSEITLLKTRSTNLESRATTLETRATTLENEVSALETKLDQLIDDMSISPSSGERSLPTNVSSGSGYNVSIPYIGSTTYSVDVRVIGTVRYKEYVCFGADCVWAWSPPEGFTHGGVTNVINKANKSFRVVFTTDYLNNETGPEIGHVQYQLQRFTYTATR